jgi:hypothetical protein
MPVTDYISWVELDGYFGPEDKKTACCILLGGPGAAEEGRRFAKGRVQLIVKCSEDLPGEPAKPASYSTNGGQEVPRLHFHVHKWSSYVDDLLTITEKCEETWLKGDGVLFQCDDGQTASPAGVAAVSYEAMGSEPLDWLNDLREYGIKMHSSYLTSLNGCQPENRNGEQIADVIMHLQKVGQGLHRISSQCSQGDVNHDSTSSQSGTATGAVAVADSPGVHTDILVGGANQILAVESDRVRGQWLTQVEAEAEELASIPARLPARPRAYGDIRQLSNNSKSSSPAAVMHTSTDGSGNIEEADSPAA